MARYKDVEGYRELFDEEYKKTRKLISEGETHLDNLAEGFSEAGRVIDNIPTADVVPKSEVESIITLNSQLEAKVFEERKEVERLKHILDCYALQYGTVIEQQEVIDKAKAEFAREIFAEIDSKILAEIDLCNGVLIEFEEADELYHRIKGEVSALCKIQDFIAELKKKHTEETK